MLGKEIHTFNISVDLVIFQTALPCHSTDLVYFRNRIGKKGFEFIFKHSIEIHSNENLNESQVIADTTIQRE